MNTQPTFPSYIDRLKAENQELLDRIADLEAVIYPKYVFPPEWHLTYAQRKCLSVLLAAREYVTKERIYSIVWHNQTPNIRKFEEPRKNLSVEALITLIRARTKIKIKTLRYQGYVIESEEKKRVLSILRPDDGK